MGAAATRLVESSILSQVSVLVVLPPVNFSGENHPTLLYPNGRGSSFKNCTVRVRISGGVQRCSQVVRQEFHTLPISGSIPLIATVGMESGMTRGSHKPIAGMPVFRVHYPLLGSTHHNKRVTQGWMVTPR